MYSTRTNFVSLLFSLRTNWHIMNVIVQISDYSKFPRLTNPVSLRFEYLHYLSYCYYIVRSSISSKISLSQARHTCHI